jgi:glycosyltransferase involved in cell wall biosynthesis
MPNVTSNKRQSVFSLLLFWLLTTLYILKQNAETIIHAHDLTGLPPIILLKITRKIKAVIYDSHELFPEAARDELGWLYGLFFLILERVCMNFVDIIIGISKEQKDLMIKRYKKPFILLLNYPSLHEIKPLYNLPKIDLNKDCTNIVFHGSIRKDRKMITLIDVFEKAKTQNNRLFLYVIGDGPDFSKVKQYAQANNVSNIIFTGKLPFSETFQYLRSCDIAIALYDVKTYTALTCSNKLYECMAAGIPSIFSDLKASRKAMKESLVIRVNPNKQDQILDALLSLIKNDQYRKKASKVSEQLFLQKYNWEKIDKNFNEMYKTL